MGKPLSRRSESGLGIRQQCHKDVKFPDSDHWTVVMNKVFLRKIFPELLMDKRAQYPQLNVPQTKHMDDMH